MYVGQISFSLLAAASAAYYIYTAESSLAIAGAVFLITFTGLRIVFATVFRTKYWISRGTKGSFSRSCPSCNQYIYRSSGDWIMRCYRCGWTAGWPIIGWFTQSVPARQLNRSITAGRICLVILGIGIVALGVTGAGGQIVPGLSEAFADIGDESSGYDEETVGTLLIELVNEERDRQGLRQLSTNERAARAAQAHADDMARNDYFSHTALDGETQQERYSFCRGGENIHQTWVGKDVEESYGDRVRYHTDEELASGIMKGWMNSEPHRERGIRGNRWRSAGAGISITEDGKVYAVLGFCSS